MGNRARLLLPLSFGLLACSGANGSLDLNVDGHTPSDATVESSMADHGDAAGSDDAPAQDEPAPLPDVDAAADDAAAGDEENLGLDDAPSEAAPSLCSMICQGCCDANGQCHTTSTTDVCGKHGEQCEDCSMKSCPLTELGCCKTGGGCGCAVGGLVGCN